MHSSTAGDFAPFSGTQFSGSRNARRRAVLSLVSAIAILDASRSIVRATTQTSTWIGGSSTAWGNAANWSPSNTYPNNGNASISDFNVVINSVPFPNSTPILNVPATIDDLTLNTSASLTLGADETLNTSGPTLTNNGSITIDQASSNADLNITSNTSITGAGFINLDNFQSLSDLALMTAPAGVTITSGANQTIDGEGAVEAALVNNGTVNGNFPNQPLLLQTFNMTNNNLMESTGSGSFLDIRGITVTQGVAGQLTSAGGAVTVTAGATIVGGTINSTAGSAVDVTLTATFSNLTISSGSTIVVVPNATLNLSGPTMTNNGTIIVDQLIGNAALNITSTLTLTGSGTVTLLASNPNAKLTAAAGAILTNDTDETINGTGEIDAPVINNGKITASMSGKSLLINHAITGAGTIGAVAGSTLAFGAGIGGSSQGALSLTGTGKLDIANNHLFINYGSGADPIASIAAEIISGYASGAWTGPGIISSTAQSNSSSYGIGYADSADPGNPAGLASGQIEIKYTLLGDANLDGAVNGTDFAILATNFNKADSPGHSGWDEGDFNYDGSINGTDFAELAANFNKGASQAADLAALDTFAAANGLSAEVPEPASACMMFLSSIVILKRRRRRS